MNRAKWKQPITDERRLAKLLEEVGEVGRAISDRFDLLPKIEEREQAIADGARGAISPRDRLRAHLRAVDANLYEELDHVIFQAQCWRKQMKREGRA